MGTVFLSYTTVSDEADGDISELHRRLSHELHEKTGDRNLVVFLDKKGIAPSQDWKRRLYEEMNTARAMVSIVTPAYLASAWCREEVTVFQDRCGERGWSDRILPVIWAQTPALTAPGDDPVARILSVPQYLDWTDLRYDEWTAGRKRRAVGQLAGAITRILDERPSQAPTRRAPPTTHPPRTDPTPALVQLLLRMFSASELRRLVRWMPDGAALAAMLPGATASPMQVAEDTVAALARAGRLDCDFFEVLRRERPRRVAEIDVVARAYGC